MAGLLDQHKFLGNQDALEMVKAEAHYFAARINKTLEVNGTEHWHQMLNVEFGGMMESMYILHGITKDPEHLRCSNALYVLRTQSIDTVLKDAACQIHKRTASSLFPWYQVRGSCGLRRCPFT